MFDVLDLVLWLLFGATGAMLTHMHYVSKDNMREDAWKFGYDQAKREQGIREASAWTSAYGQHPAVNVTPVQEPPMPRITDDIFARMGQVGQGTAFLRRKEEKK